MSLAAPTKTPLGEPPPVKPASALIVRHRLTHDLARHYDALRALRNRKALHKSALYAEIRDELSRILDGVEVGAPPPAEPPNDPPNDLAVDPAVEKPRGEKKSLRAVAWNIQRGRYFEALVAALKTDETLRGADLLLLSEVDCGMGRSGNHHVAAELAAELGMHYAFGVSYLVLGDDFLENEGGVPNTLALAGSALLSRYPIGRVENVDLPELKDKFSSRREKRLGKKRALLTEILLPDGPLIVASCHLDSNASPQQRAHQLDPLLLRARHLASTTADGKPRSDEARILVGGDFNTTTYDASAPLPLFIDLLHKFVFTGFNNVVAGYMTPELGYDRPLFEVLSKHGFTVDGFNERSRGTYHYDVMSPYAVQKLYSKVGRWATHWLQRRLRPWNGVVPARLDWFAGRGVKPVGSDVIEAPRLNQEDPPVSDHSPISVDIAL